MEQIVEKNTPLMQQYFDIKEQFKESLLLFQVGDFYELFFDDAKTAAAFLAITLTKRGKNKGEDIPLCGIPVHALNHYLTKLIKGGFRVALCEQLTKPQPGIVVERGVTRVFTPATLTESSLLDEKTASYLLSFFPSNNQWSLLFSELMTAQLFATAIPLNATRTLESELIRFIPDEIIIPNTKHTLPFATYFKKLGYATTLVDTPADTACPELARAWIETHLCSKTQALLNTSSALTSNLHTMHAYLTRTQKKALDHIKTIQYYKPDDYLVLDPSTQKNLEIITNTSESGRKNTLLEVLDKAKTTMGSRTIKKWLQRPLMQPSAIMQRLECVDVLKNNIGLMQQCATLLSGLADIERIVGRIALQRAHIVDYRALKTSLEIIPRIKSLVQIMPAQLAQTLHEKIADLGSLYDLLSCSINDDASLDHIIKTGYHQQLDAFRHLLRNGQQELLTLEQHEIARTGIPSLKVGYTQISGYYIEVTNTHAEKIPTDYHHLQTLANRKRFTTQALKQLEYNLEKARAEQESLEASVFEHIKHEVATYITPLRHTAQSIAYIDALLGFASTAYEYRYCKPTFNDHNSIIITNGRHPVVEQRVDAFTANNTNLTADTPTWIITGPNMGGKSTYLRQVALISLMAQCGSFVPAETANLAIVDRIFTRIGSGDNVAEGKSTFLVEMEEAATICLQATKHSLVILDEVGRGTSTYDGMALAQAIVEFIHATISARCLFATHYHELTALADTQHGIVNYHAASKRVNDTVLFMHKIIPGVAHASFGLDVARLAQVPEPIIQRATTILARLHQLAPTGTPMQSQDGVTNCSHNQIIQQLESNMIRLQHYQDRLAALDCSNLTPRQALDLLWELSNEAKSVKQ